MWNPLSLFKSHADKLLTASDKQLLVQAIQAAEKTTSGEIRVYVESSIPKNMDALQRAAEKFAKHKMAATHERNGVLVYVAVKDKKLAIYGDQGIHEKVGDAFWNAQVQDMIAHFKNTHYVKGMVQVIEGIGKALSNHFPYDRLTDDNELSDEIMIGK
jgi:uncharacterized membrane protein